MNLSFLDLLLVMTLEFLGSFGHCVGMCGPLAVVLSLTDSKPESGVGIGRSVANWDQRLKQASSC